MDMKYFSLFDMAIVGVPAMSIGLWQLISVNREIAKDKASKAADRALPDSAGHSVGEHRLDDR
jgi:hypothetical protein